MTEARVHEHRMLRVRAPDADLEARLRQRLEAAHLLAMRLHALVKSKQTSRRLHASFHERSVGIYSYLVCVTSCSRDSRVCSSEHPSG